MDGDGHPVILEIDVNGMRQVYQDIDLKRLDVEIVSVMIVVDAKTLENRLRNRNDSIEEIRKRLNIALKESDIVREYDYVVVNDEVEETAEKLMAIINGKNVEMDGFDSQQFKDEMEMILKQIK